MSSSEEDDLNLLVNEGSEPIPLEVVKRPSDIISDDVEGQKTPRGQESIVSEPVTCKSCAKTFFTGAAVVVIFVVAVSLIGVIPHLMSHTTPPPENQTLTQPLTPSIDTLITPSSVEIPLPRKVRLAYGTDPLQFGDLRLPPNTSSPFPLVIVVHGGYWYNSWGLTLMDAMSDRLSELGIASWNVEYRRMGDPGAGYPGTLLDLGSSADFLPGIAATYRLDMSRSIAVGHSAGGHLALWLASRHNINTSSPLWTPSPLPLKGVVSLAGVSDLVLCEQYGSCASAVRNLLGGSSQQFPSRYADASPAHLLPFGVPTISLHGTSDSTVPIAMSEAFVQQALDRGDTATLVRLEGGHFEVIDPNRPQWTAVSGAITQLLGL